MRPFTLLTVAALALVCSTGAFARSRNPGAGFELKSDVLTQVPEIASALALTGDAPDDPASWRRLGQLLADRAAYDDAIRALEIATKIAPDDPASWVDLGAVLIRADKVGRGISALKQAVKLEPYHALAHYNLGIAYKTAGNYSAAMDSFEYALTIDPSLGDPKRNGGAVANDLLGYVKLRVYLKSVGAAPSLMAPIDASRRPGALRKVSEDEPAAPDGGEEQADEPPPAPDQK